MLKEIITDIKIGNVCAALCPECLLKLHNELELNEALETKMKLKDGQERQ